MTARPGTSGADHCDHTSVGVLIPSPDGLLVFERTTPPAGIAPVAGHVDQHGSPEEAPLAEVAEEVGLTVTHLHLLLATRRPNRCRRRPTGPVGHRWWVFEAQASGPLRPSPREVRAPRWIHPAQLQPYALRTTAYAQGHLSRQAFEQEPGLAPVWVRFLNDLQLVTLPDDALDQIDTVI
ncbi:NUDIX hydrolase [Streptomyces ipomoeae]|uniref:NUDIX hydrolase n=1 Tax=Streptomyces ipomoeae TaxID=103232 RepID=A0AAE8W561_9ACTN|nr:NUDIX hydrolase [Streptomyces ipomoeae]TQE37429.1 NUDIX hydrolase [Streptomyces ipomoeae]